MCKGLKSHGNSSSNMEKQVQFLVIQALDLDLSITSGQNAMDGQDK